LCFILVCRSVWRYLFCLVSGQQNQPGGSGRKWACWLNRGQRNQTEGTDSFYSL